MDQKDRKILFELDLNARASYSQIARKTHLAQETVRYRVERMISKGVIEQFTTTINASKLGRQYYQVLLRLQNTSPQDKKELITFLVERSEIGWVGNLQGKYDIAFIVNANNTQTIHQVIEDLRNTFSHNIMSKDISVNIRGEFFPRSHLVNTARSANTSDYMQDNPTEPLGEFEEQICRSIALEARKPIISIAQELGTSSDAVIKTLRTLREQHIITGTMLKLNLAKAGLQQYKLLITLSGGKSEHMLAYIRGQKQVISIVHSLAPWDFEVDVEVERSEEQQEFVQLLTSYYAENIKHCEVLQIMNMPKFTFYP